MIRPPKTLWRYLWLTPVLGGVGLGVLWILGLLSFLVTISAMTPGRPFAATDGIVVLTGGAERVRTGLELLQDKTSPQLLISGVHRTADLQDLIRLAQLPGSDIPCCITLGFEAEDTAGNADETARWVAKHNIRSLRLVTASYHMPRALVELSRTLPGVTLIPHPVQPPGFHLMSRRGAILAVSEYHKTLLVSARWTTRVGRRWVEGLLP